MKVKGSVGYYEEAHMAVATNDQDERLQQEINAENFWKHFQLVYVVGNPLALICSGLSTIWQISLQEMPNSNTQKIFNYYRFGVNVKVPILHCR